MSAPLKIAIVVSHPIQHFCPQYVSYARVPGCRLKVFFASAIGYKKYRDVSFDREISWGNLGLEKFDHVFLNGEALLPADSQLDAPNIVQELTDFGPDVLITYGYFQRFVQRAQAWAHQKKIPVAFISDSERRRDRSLAKELIKKVIVRNRFKPVSYFLSVGDANEAYYRYYGVPDHKLLRVPFPIDLDLYKSVYARKSDIAVDIRNRYAIDKDVIVCGVVGKVEAFKRQQDIIAALAALDHVTTCPPLVLLVIGTGPNEQALKDAATRLKRHKVVFTGFIFPEELARLYTAIDIYIHPSEKDAHSLAVSEAIFMGCPVLISDKCGSYGPSDDVQQGRNGFVFTTGDVAALASLLQQVAGDEGLRKHFGGLSHQFAAQAQLQAHGEGLKALLQIVRNRKQ